MNLSEDRKENLISEIVHLIKFQTVSGKNKSELKQSFDFLKSKFSDLKTKEFKSGNEISWFFGNSDWSNLDLFFLVHIDVAPVSKREDFIPMIQGGKLYGRGAQDMKSYTYLSLEMVKNLSEKFSEKKIGILITSDEERGGFRGARDFLKMLEKENALPKFAVVPDGGDNFKFVTEGKGVLWLQVEATGHEAHASRPFDGKNPIRILQKFDDEIQKIYTDLENEKDWRTSISLNYIKSGVQMNQVPWHAEMVYDVRHIPTESKENIISNFEKVADEIGNLQVNVKLTGEEIFIDEKSEFSKKFLEISEELLGKTPDFHRMLGSSDLRFVTSRKIPAVQMIGNGGNIHEEGEWVEISSLWQWYQVHEKFCEWVLER